MILYLLLTLCKLLLQYERYGFSYIMTFWISLHLNNNATAPNEILIFNF